MHDERGLLLVLILIHFFEFHFTGGRTTAVWRTDAVNKHVIITARLEALFSPKTINSRFYQILFLSETQILNPDAFQNSRGVDGFIFWFWKNQINLDFLSKSGGSVLANNDGFESEFFGSLVKFKFILWLIFIANSIAKKVSCFLTFFQTV